MRATAIQTGVFVSELIDPDRLGLVGRVVRVELAAVEAAIGADSIPVIASLGETAGGQIVNVNADWAANELVKRAGAVQDHLPDRHRRRARRARQAHRLHQPEHPVRAPHAAALAALGACA